MLLPSAFHSIVRMGIFIIAFSLSWKSCPSNALESPQRETSGLFEHSTMLKDQSNPLERFDYQPDFYRQLMSYAQPSDLMAPSDIMATTTYSHPFLPTFANEAQLQPACGEQAPNYQFSSTPAETNPTYINFDSQNGMLCVKPAAPGLTAPSVTTLPLGVDPKEFTSKLASKAKVATQSQSRDDLNQNTIPSKSYAVCPQPCEIVSGRLKRKSSPARYYQSTETALRQEESSGRVDSVAGRVNQTSRLTKVGRKPMRRVGPHDSMKNWYIPSKLPVAKGDCDVSHGEEEFGSILSLGRNPRPWLTLVEHFSKGLEKDESTYRQQAFFKFIKERLPLFSFTDMHSLEDFLLFIKNRPEFPGEGVVSFSWLWKKEETERSLRGRKLKLLAFFDNYHRIRPEKLFPCKSPTLYQQNVIIFEVYFQAGIRRAKTWHILDEMDTFFEELKPEILKKIAGTGARQASASKVVNNFVRQAKRATITTLYQIELLYRLSLPEVPPVQQEESYILRKELNELQDFWKFFPPRGMKKDFDEKMHPSNNFISSPELQRMVGKYRTCRSYPIEMQFSKHLFAAWCLSKDTQFFAIFHKNRNSSCKTAFFSLIDDCAIADLIGSIQDY